MRMYMFDVVLISSWRESRILFLIELNCCLDLVNWCSIKVRNWLDSCWAIVELLGA